MMKKAITVSLIPDTPSNHQSLNYDLLLLLIIIIYVCEHIVTGSTDGSIIIKSNNIIIRVCLIL
jgi:hypothetical protein